MTKATFCIRFSVQNRKFCGKLNSNLTKGALSSLVLLSDWKKSFLLPAQEMCSVCAVSILTCVGEWRATSAPAGYTSKSETSIEFVF